MSTVVKVNTSAQNLSSKNTLSILLIIPNHGVIQSVNIQSGPGSMHELLGPRDRERKKNSENNLCSFSLQMSWA